MGNNRFQNHLIGGILAFLAAFGGVGCLVSGMGFEGISMTAPAVVCAVAAAVFAFTLQYRFFPAIPGALLLIGAQLWYTGGLKLSTQVMLSHISFQYRLGYGWDVIFWSNASLDSSLAKLALCVVGILIALGICWSFLKSKSIWLPAILAALPVIPCMLLTDTPPASGYLYLQLLCISLLLLIRMLRKKSPEQSLRLLKLLCLPVAAGLLLLFLLLPQSSYAGIGFADRLLDRLVSPATPPSVSVPVAPDIPSTRSQDWIDLTSVGPKQKSTRTVMEVRSDDTRVLYLRGSAYDTYLGTGWDITAVDAPILTVDPQQLHAVTITTRVTHDMLYLPPNACSILSSDLSLAEQFGQVANPELWRSYTVNYADQASSVSDADPQTYLQLPEETREEALQFLQQIPGLTALADSLSKARVIADFVSDSARYDLNTPKMPDDAKDFALWFLRESDTGYCTHFASATAVLLRAAEIPCRYATGYLVNAQADRTVDVPQHSAHAWVEVFIPGTGWVILEPTPSDGLSQTVGADIPETTAPTESTIASTDPSETVTTPTTGPTISPTTQPTQEQSTLGGSDAPTAPTEPELDPLAPFLPIIKAVLYVVGTLAALIIQWRLRVWLRMQRRNRGKPNKRALARWREVELHSRLLRTEPPAQLLELAQKARFSPHVLTRQELSQFDVWLNASASKIAMMHFGYRLLATIILALY